MTTMTVRWEKALSPSSSTADSNNRRDAVPSHNGRGVQRRRPFTVAHETARSRDETASNAADGAELRRADMQVSRDGSEVPKEIVRRVCPEYPPFVSELVGEVRDSLRKCGEPTAIKRFHVFLSKMPEDNPTRFQVFEATIRMLLLEGCPMAAVTCYTRMTAEGFICSISLRAQMTVISLANRSPAPEEFFALLEMWFMNKRFNEHAFQDMLFLLDNTISEDPAFVDAVAKLYLRCKRPGYSFARETISWIVYVHARAGSKGSAKEWLDPERHAGASGPEPYTSLLRFIDGSSEDEELYRWIVERMQELEIQPDLAFYNALMSAEFARKKYDNAYKIYGLLKASPDPAITPDEITFAMVFRASLYMSQPRSFLTRRIGRPRGAPSPRQLYQDMIRCHIARARNSFEGVLSSSSLISAMRVFMDRRDYAAAFVVFKTMRQCELPMDLVMYQRILAPLMRRLKHELPLLAVESDPRSFWSYRFLGLSTAPSRQRPAYNSRVLDVLLRIGTIPRLSLAYVAPELELATEAHSESPPGFEAPAGSSSTRNRPPPARPPTQLEDDATPSAADEAKYEAFTKVFREHNMPSTLEVAGLVESVPHQVYSPVPLERILRRAILAARPDSVLSAMKEVNSELAVAKEQMIGDLAFELSGFSTRKRKPRYVSFSEDLGKAAKKTTRAGTGEVEVEAGGC
ncbi:uncharacterized protein B0H18DRAFT_1210015 [Fomitopsis serialis]|uniref:uncharacterized protein n=1 Tax=Fomitopsis serialis TaxID=139415 RepID=UPI002007FA72|nr:uncharacterized protein B0H18DRAFT_1210015 [Neoantrodia serialis]KAH9928822.1 hypothetical protein B0H18DRAFT_1210015 [Neoantrodia serialis]